MVNIGKRIKSEKKGGGGGEWNQRSLKNIHPCMLLKFVFILKIKIK